MTARRTRTLCAVLLSLLSVPCWAAVCDVDADDDIDLLDINMIVAARNQPAHSDDPRDENSDGIITVNDARACVVQCTLARCASPPTNTPPIADPGQNRTVVLGETVTLDGSGSRDAEGDPLSFAWSVAAAPGESAAELSSGDVAHPSFVPDVVGEYRFELVVSDGALSSEAVTVQVTVLASTVVVPNVVGLDYLQAIDVLEQAGLALGSVGAGTSTEYEAGVVTDQQPAAGSSVPSASTVDVTVSLGDGYVDCPIFSELAIVVCQVTKGDAVLTLSADLELDTTASISLEVAGVTEIRQLGGETFAFPSREVFEPELVRLEVNPAIGAIRQRYANPQGFDSETVLILEREPAQASVIIDVRHEASVATAAQFIGYVDFTLGGDRDDVDFRVTDRRAFRQLGRDRAATLTVLEAPFPSLFEIGNADRLERVLAEDFLTTVPGNRVEGLSGNLAGTLGWLFSTPQGAEFRIRAKATVYTGEAQTTVPDVRGAEQAAADELIADANLTTGLVSSIPDQSFPDGVVIAQALPPGLSVPIGFPLDYGVAGAPSEISVPSVVGLPQEQAGTALLAAGLGVGLVEHEASDTAPIGEVLAQAVAAGTSVPEGTAIDLTVSAGFVAPTVLFESVTSAQAALEDAGFHVGTIQEVSGTGLPGGVVIAQQPSGESSLPVPTAINLVVTADENLRDCPLQGNLYVCTVTDGNATLRVAVNVFGNAVEEYTFEIDGVPQVYRQGYFLFDRIDESDSEDEIQVPRYDPEKRRIVLRAVETAFAEQDVITLEASGQGTQITVDTTFTSLLDEEIKGRVYGESNFRLLGTPIDQVAFVNEQRNRFLISDGETIGTVEVYPAADSYQIARTGTLTGPLEAGEYIELDESVAAGPDDFEQLFSWDVDLPARGAFRLSSVTSVQVAPERIATVPNLIGLQEQQALDAISLSQLTGGSIELQVTPATPLGEVIDQSPSPGELAPFGAPISLLVSAGQPDLDGVLLSGLPGNDALSALHDFASPTPDELLVTGELDGMPVLLSEANISLVSGATVGQVNNLLQSLNARIAGMSQDLNLLSIRFVNSTVVGLQEVLRNLYQSNVIELASPAYLGSSLTIPAGVAPTALAHQLAVGGHSLWNGSNAFLAAAAKPPTVFIFDCFGQGPPVQDEFWINPPTYNDYALEDPSLSIPTNHGYAVLEVLAGNGVGRSKGLLPFPATLRAADVVVEQPKVAGPAYGCDDYNWLNMIHQGIKLVRKELRASNDRRAVINVSNGIILTQLSRQDPRPVSDYIAELRLAISSLPEDRVIWVFAAGNEGQDARTLAGGLAVLGGGMEGPNPLWGTPPKNALVVEGRSWQRNGSGQFLPGCLFFNGEASNDGGHVSAIGAGIALKSGLDGGTSFAAPQIAAAAASVWALDPGLKSTDVIAKILDTAVDTPDGCLSDPKPVLDIYEAVLATDSWESPGFPRMRLALLDVFNERSKLSVHQEGYSPDLRFTLGDLLTFVSALRAGDREPFPTYTRYDLNDDGFASTDHRPSFPLGGFNLDLSSEVSRVGGPGPYVFTRMENVDVIVDEATVTDAQILCYYAYAPIYNRGAALDDEDKFQRTVAMLPLLRECGLGLKRVELSLKELPDGWVQPDPMEPITFKALDRYLVPRPAFLPTDPFILNAENTYNVPAPSGGVPANYGSRASTVQVDSGRLVLTAISRGVSSRLNHAVQYVVRYDSGDPLDLSDAATVSFTNSSGSTVSLPAEEATIRFVFERLH